MNSETVGSSRKYAVVVRMLLLGALLAVALLLVRGPAGGEDDLQRVVVRDSDIAQLKAGWERRWFRPPTQMELRGLVEKHVQDEVLYREALARGFDKDDQRVRLTMVQKMNFLAEGGVLQDPPDEAEIESYFNLRQERYRRPAEVSFYHLFFNTDARGGRAEADALAELAELQEEQVKPEEAASRGDRFMLQHRYVAKTERELTSLFGKEFAAEVCALEPNVWAGPLRSGYGLHLVWVDRRKESFIPQWEEVREEVVTDIQFEAKNAAREQFYQEILRNYQVVLEDGVEALLDEDGS